MHSGFNEAVITKSDYQNYWHQAIDYTSYKAKMAQDLITQPDVDRKAYISINTQRMHRVEKTYQMGEAIVTQLKALRHRSFWLILSEHWCGDSSQVLPVFNAIAAASAANIDLKLLYRDEQPALMNAFLTNDTRSIPKLIQLNEHWNVTGIWGPRPSVAQKLVKELKLNPLTAANYNHDLHLWYARDKQQAIESEVLKLLIKADLFCPDCLS